MPPSTNKKTYYNMGNFFDFLRIGNEPMEIWGVWSVLIFLERRTVLLEEYDVRVQKPKRLPQKKISNRPRNRIWAPTLPLSLRKFLRTTGLTYLAESDFEMIDVEAKSRESTHRCPRGQAVEIPISA